MTVLLRVVLDQIVAPTNADLGRASRELTRALVATAPAGCAVEGIVPAASDVSATIEAAVPGLADLTRAALPRRELAATWQLGVVSGIGGGLIHSPTLLAPLVRHDRVHDHDQTVVTLWDLAAWEYPDEVGRAGVLWHRAMLKRAVKHADAVVVPSHAMAARVAELGPLSERLRVVAGAAPRGFAVPTDEIGRRRDLELPERFVLVAGSSTPSARLSDAFDAIARADGDLPLVVVEVPEGDADAVGELAEESGIPRERLHVHGSLGDADRAAVLGGAVAFVAPSRATEFPWRVVEALAVGVPVVAVDTPSHREVILDGGVLVDGGASDDTGDALAAGLNEVLASTSSVTRFGVLAADRGRAFSWAGAAERVWQLHADL